MTFERYQTEKIWIREITKRKEPPLSDSLIRSTLKPYGVVLSDAQVESVQRYVRILLLWNQKINLTGLHDPKEIVERHFGESMFAATVIPLERGRLADVGTGAGFPGLALKIVCPDLEVFLIEANTKKAAFLAEVRRALGFPGVEILRNRAEELRFRLGFIDFVSARAVGNLPRLLAWARDALRPNGSLLLWLGAKDAGTIQTTKGWSWREPIPIPKSERRTLLIGQVLHS